MSDGEKLVKGLETIRYNLRQMNHGLLADFCDDVLALLKGHETVEPELAEHIMFGTSRKCSVCGKYLFPAGEFCPHCGRAVKWE